MHLSAQVQKCAPKRQPVVAGASRSVSDRNAKKPVTRPASKGKSSLVQNSPSDSLRKQPNNSKPIHSLRRSKSDPATHHTLVQTSLLSLTLNPDTLHPISPQNEFPSWIHQSSEVHSEFEMAHFVSQILAQKKGLESDVRVLSSTLSKERDILFRLWNINPSLPIDSLMRLLLLSQEKDERTARLKAIQQAQIDLRHRFTLLDDRQSYLDARERSLSSKALEGCRSSFVNRRAGIRRERSQLEAEIKLRERQESDLCGDIQGLDCEEANYWRALERMSSSSSSSSSSTLGVAQAQRPKLKDPTLLMSKSARRVTMYYDDDVEADPMDGEEVEGAGQLDVIPEIPDSPPPPTSMIPLPNISNLPPELSISVDHTFVVDGPSDSSGSTDLQWRQSSSGSANSSSGVDSSVIGPQTPRTMVHDTADDRSSIIIHDDDDDAPHWKFPSNHRDSAISRSVKSSNDFRKTIHFPSFSIPPLASSSPDDTPEDTDTHLLRTSAYSIISSPLSVIDVNNPSEGTHGSRSTQSRPPAFLGPMARTQQQQTGLRSRTVQNKFSRPSSEVPVAAAAVAAEQRPIPNWGIFKNILGAPRRLRKSKSGNTAGVMQENNSSGTLGAVAADDQVAST